ncbi:transglycosylase SLT domain-containing protein [Gloeocapsa sp. PCC 73106]|uniref:transglycosylase SLT domain-containing protein n=1 Tax=Gloeocapsa sp. PCC 73106 TaxID=102232 RepID=UPI0002AC8DF7|nr:transglycosylase SLT domain-containing protein [Gloeocapsa sp. PCC 73106]ELR96291.1 soluble lytic murein transglycosylase-like protein [Gloeocapsa sp. PCC 73106]
MGKPKNIKKRYLFLVATSLLGGFGAYFFFKPQINSFGRELLAIAEDYRFHLLKSAIEPEIQPSVVLNLVLQTPEAREAELRKIAAGTPSQERNRARYLLASDLLQAYEGGEALTLLKRLEYTYPLMTPYILLKRGRAYELTNDKEQAQAVWLKLFEDYPKSAASAQALYQLGNYDPQYLEEMISRFPQHPLTHEIVRKRLDSNPDQFDLLLLLATYDHSDETNQIRDRLVLEYSDRLTQKDWQTIGGGYWQNREYRKASDAYRFDPGNPRSLYRTAKGLETSGNPREAISWYKKLVIQFPDAQETALALEHLATLSEAKASLFYLDLLIEKFPEQGAMAFYRKGIILDFLESYESAEQARKTLLTEYPDSEAAIEYRWQMAQKSAQSGNKQQAIDWIQPILATSSSSDIAAEAVFWMGKWSLDLGKTKEAETAFEYVLTHHWQSYYAWRSAVLLGWDVGDFTDVRLMNPEVTLPRTRSVPPAGSATFQELFILGQDADARYLFESEIGDRQEPSVAEQFTVALLKLEQQQYRQAINLIWNLKTREEPQDIAEWQKLRQTSEYWQALFPFPHYQTILAWSLERDLNPLLVISLIRQESTFEVEALSPVGATGLMQVMPSTAKWISEISDIDSNYSLVNPEDNVSLGSWYFNHTHEQYQDNSLLAVASYNAGPGNVNKWKKKYPLTDPDVFVNNIPFPETKGYVKSVFGNYWNYLRIYNPQVSQLLSQ